MKKSFLSRYARTETGAVILDVAAARVPDLYNDFDKVSPYLKKDLDQNLVDYLVDSAREVGNVPFAIRITLNEAPTGEIASRVRKSMRNFFTYLEELERRSLRKMIRTSLILLGIGVGILAVAVWANQITASTENVLAHVFSEGLTVAAWVSLWEALATFLIHWVPSRQEIAIFRRLSGATVQIVAGPDKGGQATLL